MMKKFPLFEKNQYNKIFSILKLNEKDNIFLSIDTVIKHYKTRTGIVLEIKLVKSGENVNKEKTSYFINLLKKNPGIVDTNDIQNIFNSFKNENVEKYFIKKFFNI